MLFVYIHEIHFDHPATGTGIIGISQVKFKQAVIFRVKMVNYQ
jgi:hypothetical protein